MTQRYAITTGRFQPMHMAHVMYWRHIVEQLNLPLVICVLKKQERLADSVICSFAASSTEHHQRERNPMSDSQRLRLVQLAVLDDEVLNGRTTVVLRTRPDIGWSESLDGLPENRLWIFNPLKDNFDHIKSEHYKGRGEGVELLPMTRYNGWNGQIIRNALQSGDSSLDFLPNSCRTFFREECLSLFIF